MTNITLPSTTEQISNLFQILSVSPRLEILLAIGGAGEACVCHLEAALGYRQAYISQHLMALREANLLDTRRAGRYIYYRLADPRLLEVLLQAGALLGQTVTVQTTPLADCACPNCASARTAQPGCGCSDHSTGQAA